MVGGWRFDDCSIGGTDEEAGVGAILSEGRVGG